MPFKSGKEKEREGLRISSIPFLNNTLLFWIKGFVLREQKYCASYKFLEEIDQYFVEWKGQTYEVLGQKETYTLFMLMISLFNCNRFHL